MHSLQSYVVAINKKQKMNILLFKLFSSLSVTDSFFQLFYFSTSILVLLFCTLSQDSDAKWQKSAFWGLNPHIMVVVTLCGGIKVIWPLKVTIHVLNYALIIVVLMLPHSSINIYYLCSFCVNSLLHKS